MGAQRPPTKAEIWSLTMRHVRFSELSPLAAKVLAILFGAAGTPEGDLWEQATFRVRLRMATLAERTGRGLSTVRAALAELEDPTRCGWLSRIRTGRSNILVLTLPGRVRVVADRQNAGGQTARTSAVRPPESRRSTLQESLPEPSLQGGGVRADARMAEALAFARERGAANPEAYAAAVLASGRPIKSEAAKRRRSTAEFLARMAAEDARTAARRAAAMEAQSCTRSESTPNPFPRPAWSSGRARALQSSAGGVP